MAGSPVSGPGARHGRARLADPGYKVEIIMIAARA
jgi:hypothetical protein